MFHGKIKKKSGNVITIKVRIIVPLWEVITLRKPKGTSQMLTMFIYFLNKIEFISFSFNINMRKKNHISCSILFKIKLQSILESPSSINNIF